MNTDASCTLVQCAIGKHQISAIYSNLREIFLLFLKINKMSWCQMIVIISLMFQLDIWNSAAAANMYFGDLRPIPFGSPVSIPTTEPPSKQTKRNPQEIKAIATPPHDQSSVHRMVKITWSRICNAELDSWSLVISYENHWVHCVTKRQGVLISLIFADVHRFEASFNFHFQ